MLLAQIMLTVGLLILIYMTLWWTIATLKKDMSLVDIAWGPGFILIAWFMLLFSQTTSSIQWLTTILVTIWGARLAIHVGARHDREDWRYRNWRNQWTWVKTRSYFQVFLFQGVVMLLISLPILLINMHAQLELGWLAILGIFFWLVGFFWEATADWQLACFKKNLRNKKRLMTRGLWHYSRHPNYFGESLLWWGFGLIAASLPGGWFGLISPLLLTTMLLQVSGIPLVEKRYKGRPGWAAYKKNTSMFIPWFPKK